MRRSIRRRPLAALSVGLLALLALLAAPTSAPAQNNKLDPFGTEVLRRLLDSKHFKPLSSWSQLDDAPARTLLVLLGRMRGRDGEMELSRFPNGLSRFLEEGGAVLLATDQRLESEELSEVCGAGVSGLPVFAWGRHDRGSDETAFQRQRESPFVFPFENAEFPLFAKLKSGPHKQRLRVATNWPSFLERMTPRIPDGVKLLAHFPPESVFVEWGDWEKSVNPRRLIFALSCEHGKGRLLLLSDHSIFINHLLLNNVQEDNWDFAVNSINWLKGDAQERNRVLFVYDGKIETSLDALLRSTPVSLLDEQARLVANANAQLKRFEESHRQKNGINEGLIDTVGSVAADKLFGGRPWQSFYRLLVLLAVLGAFFYGVARLRRASFAPEPNVPLFATAASRQAPSASPLLQRYRHAVQEDNLADYAHVLAQEWLGSVYRGEAGRPPRVVAEGGWWERRSLSNLVGRVWKMAQADVPERMSQREFRSFLADLERLRKALAVGHLRLE
ncbi:MAG TPA: hypothetical protein VKD72_30910 [Gemmataceae bacterium]|nr:hypothetical protein [Gemmataceae bacterium]